MDFVRLNRHKFTGTILARGREYQEMGNVELLNFTSTHVNAIVDGSEPYEVHMEFAKDGHITRHHCTCPYHQGGHLCKHLAAVLYELNERPDDFFVQYPLETEENTPFRGAMGWKKEEFVAKSIEALKAVPTDDADTHRAEVARFYRALHEVFGYTSFKDEANAIYEVYLSTLDTPHEPYFLPDFVSFTGSQSVISTFFSRSLSRPRTKERIQKYIIDHPEVVEKLSPVFITSLSPINIFKHCTTGILEIFAKRFDFNNEDDVETFIEACEEQQAIEALKTLLDTSYYAGRRNASHILSYLREHSGGNEIESMLSAMKARRISVRDFIESYLALSLEERQQVLDELEPNFKYLYGNCYHAMCIACGQELPVNSFYQLYLDELTPLLPILKESSRSYLERVIPKYLRKVISIYHRTFLDTESFARLVNMIAEFGAIPSVAMLLLDPYFGDYSRNSDELRFIYLNGVTRLGLERQVGLKPFYEV